VPWREEVLFQSTDRLSRKPEARRQVACCINSSRADRVRIVCQWRLQECQERRGSISKQQDVDPPRDRLCIGALGQRACGAAVQRPRSCSTYLVAADSRYRWSVFLPGGAHISFQNVRPYHALEKLRRAVKSHLKFTHPDADDSSCAERSPEYGMLAEHQAAEGCP